MTGPDLSPQAPKPPLRLEPHEVEFWKACYLMTFHDERVTNRECVCDYAVECLRARRPL